ncbi:hypothetical protein Tco_1385233 [Tanacetum coccineum]
MTNKIATVLKAITDQIAGTLPSDTVKNLKLSTSPVLSARSYPNMDPQCSNHIHGSINAITIHTKQQSASYDDGEKENKEEEDDPKNIHVNPPTPPDPYVTFITKKVLKFNSFFESLGLVPPSSNTELIYTKEEDGDIMRRKLNPKENRNGGINNFTGRIKGMHVFIGNFTYIVDFMIIEDISSIIDPRLSQVVLGKPFVEISNMTHDPPEGVVRFTNENNEVAYKMPHKIEQYDSLSNLEKEHIKSVYLRNEEDKRRGVEVIFDEKKLGILYKVHWMILGGRFNKAHLLEDKQIPSVGVFDETFISIFATFRRAAIERLAQYEDKGWIDAFIPDEVSLNYENPNIKQLLGIIESKFDTLMKDAISLMGKSESIFRLTTNEMYRPPSEPSQEFMEFSSEVARRLKERIKENENKPRKIKKITKYQDTKVLENSAKYEFLENLEKKTFPTSTNLLCDLSNTTKALNKQVRSVQKDQQEVSEDRRIIVNGDAPAANCTS